VEINAHSLFSKWFSESGKLVSKVFAKIGELVRAPQQALCHAVLVPCVVVRTRMPGSLSRP